MATPLTKLLFLEVDAADKSLIETWAQQGLLPTWRELLGSGLVVDTLAPEGFFIGSVWPSLYTGTSPAAHGFQSFTKLRLGTYEFFKAQPGRDVRGRPFWEDLSEAGRRVAIFDVPLSNISEGLNGIQTVEWGFHDAALGFKTWPPELGREIERRFGAYPLSWRCNASNRTAAQFAEFRDRLVAAVSKKSELTRHFLSEGDWDLVAQVFTESHCVGHQCWHLHDPDHPGHDPQLAATVGDPVRDVYQAIDRALAEILDLAGPDTPVVLLAGHGMQIKRGADFLMPEILVALGVAEMSAADAQPDLTALERMERWLMEGWRRLPRAVKPQLAWLRGLLRKRFDLAEKPIRQRLDLARSLCFHIDNGHAISGIRVNLRGREPQGLVAPGEEYQRLCARLTEDFYELRHRDSGEPAVKRVLRTAEIYSGERLADLPDLVIEWGRHPLGSATCGNPAGSRICLVSPKTGTVEGTNSYCRTGDHHPRGLMVVRAKGLPPQRLDRVVPLTDVAPTLAALAGVKLANAEGRPIPEIVAAAAREPVRSA